MQSAFAPAGPHAERVAALAWAMFVGGGLILALVVALAVYAVAARPERRAWLARREAVVAGGIAFPVVVLTLLLIYGLLIARDLVTVGPPALAVEVVGERYWWRVHYRDAEGRTRAAAANEIRMPVGRPVEFVLKAGDVIHSFWVPSLAGKLDMIPGRENVYRFQADRAGIYRGQCAEYCGAQHALMAFYVVAMEPPAFEAWLAAEARPAAEPADEFLQKGQELFLANCASCHAVRGTPADGRLGPDLTHVGSRLSLAAGTYPNNVGTLAGWTASAQHLKPGSLMPSFGVLTGEELRAVAAYLENLK